MNKVIGGYFELEVKPKENLMFSKENFFFLNSGRNALQFILKGLSEEPTKIFIPIYTCEVIPACIDHLEIPFELYKINEKLEADPSVFDTLQQSEYIIINNYFGLKDQYINTLLKKYPHLADNIIVDGAQSLFYMNKHISKIFYSLPKFVGLPDGGIAYIKQPSERYSKIFNELTKSTSHQNFSHLLKRLDTGAESGYQDFLSNSDKMDFTIKSMSNLTYKLFSTFDFENIQEKRTQNFQLLHQTLKSINLFKIDNTLQGVPLTYPLLITNGSGLKNFLIKNKIFVPSYWPGNKNSKDQSSIENLFANEMVFLPIDQRYDALDMNHIINLISEFLKLNK